MQFLRSLHDRIRSGEITTTIRLWQRPHVKVGGRYALPPGEIVVTNLFEITLGDITPELARESGFAGTVDLLKVAKHGAGRRVFFIEFRYVAPSRRDHRRLPNSSNNTWHDLVREVRQRIKALPRIDTPSVRGLRRRYSNVLARESPDVVLRFVRSLLREASWAERVVAWEILAAHKAMAKLNDQLAEEMANGLTDWGSVDLFGVTVLGQAWRAGQVTDRRILSWAKSPDRWHRRLALVATVPLNARARGGSGDAKRTLRVCRLLLDDSDAIVKKALSWSLRELAKRHPQAVEAFLLREGERVPARVRREVWNKLRTGTKAAKPAR